MPFNPHSFLQEEILTQPDDWARVVSRVDEARAALPPVGARVAVVGCGTSWFMAQAYAALREAAGQGETDAFAAIGVPRRPRATTACSPSPAPAPPPRCSSLLRAGGHDADHGDHGRRRTPRPSTLADEVVVLDFADERSVVQTRFATTALALLRAHLGRGPRRGAVADARAALAQDEPLPAGLVDAEQFTFLGRGWTVGLAQEAALKMREAAPLWTEAYPAMEYRHGPISISRAGPGDLDVRRRARGPRRAGRATGAPLRAPRPRPAGRPGPRAAARRRQGPAGRPRPGQPPLT